MVCGELDASQRARLGKMSQVALASPALSVRRPGFLAELAFKKLKTGKVPEAAKLVPTYLGDVESTT